MLAACNVGFVESNELIVQFRLIEGGLAWNFIFACILIFHLFIFISHLCLKYTKDSITWLKQGFHWGKHWGLPGEDSGGMWIQCPRPCSVKIAQPSSLWSGCRITSAIIIKGCMYQEKSAIYVLTSAGLNKMSREWGEINLIKNLSYITNTKVPQ